MRRFITFLVPVLLSLAGTSCTSNGPCDRVASKLDSCGVGVARGSTVLCESSDPVAKCKLDCLMNAACANLLPTSKDGPFVICERDCYVLGPDPFTCDDLSGFASRDQVCDSKIECSDGSDEKGCPDGGAKDAGDAATD